MEDMREIPESALRGFYDKAVFASAFQAALQLELIVLEWAFSKGYSRIIGEDRSGNPIYPRFSKAVRHLKKDPHIPESLITQIEKAWDTRNDLVHNFAWKSLLLGPEQSRDLILDEAYVTLQAAWFAVHDERCRSSL